MKEVKEFEELIADYYGAPYAIAIDCCTHAIELCLRILQPKKVTVPKHTYLSVPMTMNKLNIDWEWKDDYWNDYYYIGNTNIVDAAVYWQKNGYEPHTLMCLSFQFKKHLSLGRGGMVLTDDKNIYDELQCLKYDGRQNDIPWQEQNIEKMGYHYYMTPETALKGISKFDEVSRTEPIRKGYKDYIDLSGMKVFNAKS